MTSLNQAERALMPVVTQGSYDEGVAEEVRLSKYISWPDDNIASSDTLEIFLLQGLVDIFTQARDKIGVPVHINSGYRTQAKQDDLKKKGYKAAKISPHSHGAAFDCDISRLPQTGHFRRCMAWVNACEEAARNLGTLDYFRFGLYNWGVHMGIVPILFDKQWQNFTRRLPLEFYPKYDEIGYENPNPKDWKGGINWDVRNK